MTVPQILSEEILAEKMREYPNTHYIRILQRLYDKALRGETILYREFESVCRMYTAKEFFRLYPNLPIHKLCISVYKYPMHYYVQDTCHFGKLFRQFYITSGKFTQVLQDAKMIQYDKFLKGE